MVAIINKVKIDKCDLTDIRPANVRIISDGTIGKTFSNKINIKMAAYPKRLINSVIICSIIKNKLLLFSAIADK